MGNRNYTCDYCQNTFKDTAELRKKHLNGLQHKINYEKHYVKFKDPSVILREESLKTPCSRVMNGQECKFENFCRFSHYTPQAIWNLKQKAHIKEYQNWENNQVKSATQENLDNFFRRRNERILAERIEYPIFWDYPPEFLDIPNLPPSLRKIDPAKINPEEFKEWG